METIKSLASLALIFVFINGLLWGGQELYHYSDNKKLDTIEKQISDLDSQTSKIESDAKIHGITDSSYSKYSSMVDQRNKLADEYNKLNKETGSRFYLIPIPLGRSKAIK